MHTAALNGDGTFLNADGGWNLGVPWDYNFSFDTRCGTLIALVLSGAAVFPISAAHRLGRDERKCCFHILFFSSSFIVKKVDFIRL